MGQDKLLKRVSRHQRVREKVKGAPERPRLCIYRSLSNLYAQIIDDTKGATLLNISTLHKSLRAQVKYGGNVKAAAALGELVAKTAKEKGINKVSFDRGGYLYHGRIKAFAEAARKGGLEF
jgi:large subunit ribosomal protein L18